MHTQKFLVTRMIAAFVIGGLLGVAMLYAEPYSWRTADIPLHRDSLPAHSSDVMYYGSVRGYLSQPAGWEKRPALILIHESWGLSEDMKSLARQFANEGYVALAVDLYGGETTDDPLRARELVAEMQSNRESVFNNLRGALEYLRAKENVDPARIASVGWGAGGTWSYQMAQSDLGIRGSVMYYGEFEPLENIEHVRTSILGHFAELDASIPVDSVRGFEARLATLHGAHEVYIYPLVDHGFANERGGTNPQYDKEVSLLAWDRTVEFLMHALEEE